MSARECIYQTYIPPIELYMRRESDTIAASPTNSIFFLVYGHQYTNTWLDGPESVHNVVFMDTYVLPSLVWLLYDSLCQVKNHNKLSRRTWREYMGFSAHHKWPYIIGLLRVDRAPRMAELARRR